MIRFKSWLPFALALSASFLAGCSEDDPAPEKKVPAPIIVKFEAQPNDIEPGMWTKLVWTTENATSVRITEVVGGKNIDIGSAEAAKGEITVTPTQSTAYALTAIGHGKEASKSLTVRVGPPDRPSASLTATPARVDFGGSTSLKWTAEDHFRVTLYEGTKVLMADEENDTGSFVVSPERDTTYRLVAEGVGGRTQVELPVGVFAVIESFTVSATGSQPVGTEVELKWITAGAEKLVVSNHSDFERTLSPAPGSGSLMAPVGTSGTFTLTAFRGENETTKQVKVDVLTTPDITSFTATAEFLTRSDEPIEVSFSWEVAGADTLTLTATPGGEIELDDEALPTGSIVYPVTDTASFTLTATNDAGTTSRTVTVTVVDAPEIFSFGSLYPQVGAGDEFELSWSTNSGATWEILRNGETVAEPTEMTGTILVSIDEDAVFTLRMTNAAGAMVQAMHAVIVGVPVVASFSADPSAGAPDSTVLLQWWIESATSVKVFGPGDDVVPVCDIEDDDLLRTGSCEITLPDTVGEYDYVLEATNGSGSITSTLTVEVAIPAIE